MERFGFQGDQRLKVTRVTRIDAVNIEIRLSSTSRVKIWMGSVIPAGIKENRKRYAIARPRTIPRRIPPRSLLTVIHAPTNRG